MLWRSISGGTEESTYALSSRALMQRLQCEATSLACGGLDVLATGSLYLVGDLISQLSIKTD